MRKIIRQTASALFLFLSLNAHVPAEDWRNLVQPSGTLLAVENSATVNDRLGGKPPFDPGTDVTTIQTSTPLYFVRFYNPNSTENASQAIGSWVMRSATVRGLTATEVRNIFALPTHPSMMTLVRVPENSKMYTGIAAPIDGWGEGGAQQSKLIGPPWVPAENFMNQQAIGECILCYRTMTMDSNANHTAIYLDHRIPAAYSDLEKVYTNLDLLYFQPTRTQFTEALQQISPMRYDNLASDALRANALFNEAVDQRVFTQFMGAWHDNAVLENETSNNLRAWVRFAGSSEKAIDLGFKSKASAIFAGADKLLDHSTLLGITAGFVRSDLDWNNVMGGVKTDYFKLGSYAARQTGNWLLQLGLNAGISEGDASRHLAFAMMDRTATANTDGWEGNARMQIGYHLPFEPFAITPILSLDYIHQHRHGFTEKGADSLNLRVQSLSNRTLRSYLGFVATSETKLKNNTVLSPQLQIGWAKVHPLDDRTITANLDGQLDRFATLGSTGTTNAFIANLGANLISGKNFSFFLQYGIEHSQQMKEHQVSGRMAYSF